MKPKALIFDVGGVLLRTHDRSPRQTLEAKHQLSPGGAEALYFASETGRQAQRGELTIHQLWDHIATELSLSKDDLAEFKDLFWAGDKMDYDLIDLVRHAHKTMKTAIISNYSDELASELHNTFKVTDAFDIITVSATERLTKPGHEIFNLTLDRLGAKAQDAVFVDDFKNNIAAATELGMHAILFDADTIYDELAKVGISK